MWSTATMSMTQTLRFERTTGEMEHAVLEFCPGQSSDPEAFQNETRTIRRHLRVNPSPGNRVTAGTTANAQGGYALLISFSTGHALPLLGRRSGRPRNRRGEDAEQTRSTHASDTRCPSHSLIRRAGHCQSAISHSPWTQISCVSGESMSAFSPRPRVHPHTVRTSGHAKVSTFRKQSAVLGRPFPQSRHRHESFVNRGRQASGCVTALLFPVHCRPISRFAGETLRLPGVRSATTRR